MPIRIAPAEIVKKYLVNSDVKYGTSGTFVEVRRATVGDEEKRFELFKTITEKTYLDGMKEVDYELPIYELMWEEIGLTLSGTNLEAEDGSPLISFTNKRVTDPEQMKAALRSLQDKELMKEIHQCVLDVNKHWKMDDNGKPVGE